MPGFELRAPIETERLLLRPYTADDAEAVFSIRSLPEVARYLYGSPWTLADARTAVGARARDVGLSEDGDVIALAAERREDGCVIGELTFWLRSAEHRQGEIGFVFHPDSQGRGYAREASAAILDLAFGELGLHRVYGRTDARNEASIGLMRRLGMREEPERMQGDAVFAILDDEWRTAT